MLLYKFEVCDIKELKFCKEQEASALLRGLETKTLLSKIPLVCPRFVLRVLNKLIQGKK